MDMSPLVSGDVPIVSQAFSAAGLRALDADTRAFALVGSFMGHFALLEGGINTALAQFLGLKGAKAAILTRNISFDDKIKSLRALVNLVVVDPVLAKNFDDLCKKAQTYGATRNIVAHTPFRASPITDGVEFFAIEAKSKLRVPEMDWSVEDFMSRIESIREIDNDIRAIESRILQNFAAALSELRVPLFPPASTDEPHSE